MILFFFTKNFKFILIDQRFTWICNIIIFLEDQSISIFNFESYLIVFYNFLRKTCWIFIKSWYILFINKKYIVIVIILLPIK